MTAKAKTTPLQTIAKDLESKDFATYSPEVSKDNPFEQLYVSLGQDESERDFILQLVFVNDLASAMGVEQDSDDPFLLQFFLSFPFLAKKTTVNETALLALTLNRIIPLGAIGLSQAEGTLYFQYVLACPDDKPSSILIEEVVSMIGMFVTEFAPKLELVATGKKKSKEVVDEMEKLGLKIPPVMPPPNATQ